MHINQADLSHWLKATLYVVGKFCIVLVLLRLKPSFFGSENTLYEKMKAYGNTEWNECEVFKEAQE